MLELAMSRKGQRIEQVSDGRLCIAFTFDISVQLISMAGQHTYHASERTSHTSPQTHTSP